MNVFFVCVMLLVLLSLTATNVLLLATFGLLIKKPNSEWKIENEKEDM
jgi:hypothetical protein